MEHHDVDVNLLFLDLRKHLVNVMVGVRVDSRLQLSFVLADNCCTVIATADKALLGLRHVCLVYPVAS